VNLGVDGVDRKTLANHTGVTVNAGDVVAYDTSNDLSVKLDDTQKSLNQFCVAAATIGNSSTGEFIMSGVVSVASTGSIARGQYVWKGATTKTVEDSGTAMGTANVPPAGALGVALAAASGGFVTVLLFGITAANTTTGGYRVTGLQGTNNAGTPNTKWD